MLRAWIGSVSWPLLLVYPLLAAVLQGALIVLIIQRRDLSSLDHFVFLYLVFHFTIDLLRLLASLVIVLRLGAPRLAELREGEWPPLSVVIPCHNEAETIRSLQAVDYPDLRIIVVDEGSSDDTAAIAAGRATPVRGRGGCPGGPFVRPESRQLDH